MPTFQGNPFSNFFKRILQFGHSGNNGTPTSTTNIQGGDGVATAISLSDDVLQVKPQNDNSLQTLVVFNAGGSTIFKVDTTNSRVMVGASQVATNTQTVHFGTDATESGGFAADTHYMIPFAGKTTSSVADHTIGTGTDPDLTLTVSTSADGLVNSIWHILDNITIDSVIWWSGSANSTGEATRAHLVSYRIDSSNGSTSGDLTQGTIIADGADITNAGYEQAYYQSMTIQSADIDAGDVVAFIFRQDGTNGNYAINATIKYHII